MADQGYVESLLSGLQDSTLRKIMSTVFRYVLKDIRFGRAEDGVVSVNMGGGFYRSTTPSVANREFTIRHSFGRPPYLLIPVLPLDQVGATIIPLRVERAADDNRIYLSSSETDQPVVVYLEG